MGDNDFRSIFCEIMDRYRSYFGRLLLVHSSICPFVNNLQSVSCERNSSYTFWPVILKLLLQFSAISFETSQMIRPSPENGQMVSAQYLVKELMNLDHILHTY